MNLNSKNIRISFINDIENLKNLGVEKILISGGAGTIGSNYIKQILISYFSC